MSDEELVSQAQSGDLRAFDELVARHQERVCALAYRVLGNADDAADIQQETFVRAWRSLKSFRRQSAFSTWLHRITLNLCLSRKRGRQWSTQTVAFDELRHSAECSSAVSCAKRAEATILVREALTQMPARHRALIVLRDMEGRSFQEIAEITGGSVESVRTRLSRARKLLRDKMRPYLEEEVV